MDDWFSVVDARCELSVGAVQDLCDVGFVVISGPVASDRLAQFAEAYDSAVVCARADDVSIGSSTTRVNDFVNTCTDLSSRRAVASSNNHSSSAQCMRELCDHTHRRRIFMWTSGTKRAAGRW